MRLIRIDGAVGEGGGQVLRSALSLSLITGHPVEIFNIRARRPTPGLMPQHLRAVEAATSISTAQTENVAPGSQMIRFVPGRVSPGEYSFDIGTAGAASLLFQTLHLPLALAGRASQIRIRGGTHVPWSPSFHYLQLQWKHYMQQLGFRVQLELKRAGFYPRGGGMMEAFIEPIQQINGLRAIERGPLRRITGLSAFGMLPESIARRQRRRALSRLLSGGVPCTIDLLALQSDSPGTMLLLLAEFESARACFFSLGQRRLPAEVVADQAVDQLNEYLRHQGALEPYLADQLLLALSLSPNPSTITTSSITTHLLTNVDVIRSFLRRSIRVSGFIGGEGEVSIA